MRFYYAAEYPDSKVSAFGVDLSYTRFLPRAFASRAAMNEWVAFGPAREDLQGHRAAMPDMDRKARAEARAWATRNSVLAGLAHDGWHYVALVAKAAELSLPLSFRSDLEHHDRVALAAYDARLPFGWAIRECGTHLVLPHRAAKAGFEASSEAACVAFARALAGEPSRFFWWDGARLSEVASAEALAEMVLAEFEGMRAARAA